MPSTDDAQFEFLLRSDVLREGLLNRISQKGREPIFEDPTHILSPKLAQHWASLGFNQLYFHQAEAINLAKTGSNVVVNTGTSSGKTACFAAPIFESLLNEPFARALVLYPTKALAQDQAQRFDTLSPSEGIRVAVYDGDTPPRQRGAIRKSAQIIISNPDMLHIGILPNHENWSQFFRFLRYVVIDEVHAYRGIFGAHMRMVLARLARVCETYGAEPQYLAASATLGNAESHAASMIGQFVRTVSLDTSPQGDRHLWTWAAPDGFQGSSSRMVADLLVNAAENDRRAIAFCRSRMGVEVVMRHARESLASIDLPSHFVESYRAGYTPDERRTIEHSMFSGQTRAIVATSAMELGVDIGNVDIAILHGFPSTIASFRQQSGRAGRSGREGLTVFVAQDDPLDFWLATEPQDLLFGEPESIHTPKFNKHVMSQHFLCMAFERPLTGSWIEQRFGKKAEVLLDEVAEQGELHFRTGYYYYPSYTSPAANVDLRTAGGKPLKIVSDDQVIGTMEPWRAYQSAYPGASYLHRGETFEVTLFDAVAKQITVRRSDQGFMTQALIQSVVLPTATIESFEADPFVLTLGGVSVTSVVHGCQKSGSSDPESVIAVEMPSISFDTVGLSINLPVSDELDLQHLSAIHGLEHALINSAPFLANCDRNDLGSTWMVSGEGDRGARVTVFDRCPGGIGLCEGLWGNLVGWLNASLRLLERCPCESGCPRCLLRSGCESANDHLNKSGAIQLLASIVDVLDS